MLKPSQTSYARYVTAKLSKSAWRPHQTPSY